MLGAHLEGPWLNVNRAGAQDVQSVRAPSRAELQDLVEAGCGSLALITMAPELPGALSVITQAVDLGIRVAIGHTDADYDMSRRAFAAGASHVTHLFNAMRSIHHRDPGPVVAALAEPGVTLELIADGHHVHGAVMALVTAIAGPRLVAVTDATAATGRPSARYALGQLKVEVSEDRAFLAGHPGTLAGSVLTMDRAYRNLLTLAGMTTATALAATSAIPARAVGALRKGRLSPDADADIVVIEESGDIAATIVRGVPVYDPGGLFS